jgi:hypothetical protein
MRSEIALDGGLANTNASSDFSANAANPPWTNQFTVRDLTIYRAQNLSAIK